MGQKTTLGWKAGGRAASAAGGSVVFPPTAAYFALALLFGGAGDDYPLATLAVESGAALLLGWLLWAPPRPAAPVGTLAGAIVLLAAAVPVLQLIPLPFPLWSSLPGRDLPAEILALAGAESAWRPLSLDPAATLRSALAMLPGLALFFAGLRLSADERLRLLFILIAVALASVVLGSLQRASGGAPWVTPFESSHRGYGAGLFVNRNHQATFLLIACLATAGAARARGALKPGPAQLGVAAGLILLFAAGVVATTSRSGLLVLVPTLALSLLLLFPRGITPVRFFGGLLLLGVAVIAAARVGAVRTTLNRFTSDLDIRFDYWADTIAAIANHWPVGSGLGTFVNAYAVFESLEAVVPTYAANAHNDYLELLLEAGLPALIGMTLFILFFLVAGVRLWRGWTRAPAAAGLAAWAGIAVILLHSIVDYPLRMLSLMAVFGLFCAMLARGGGSILPGGSR